MERTEREINLLDLLETICMKWRVIILFLVIGLVVGGAVATVQAAYNKSQSDSDALAAKTEETEKTLAIAESELAAVDDTGELKKTADDNAAIYLYKATLYDMQEEYLEKSIYYSIDEQNVAKSILSYHIDNHYLAEYPVVESYNNIADVTRYYVDCIASYDVYGRIINEVYKDSEYQYIRELINVEMVSTCNIKISVVADTEENAKKMSGIIQDEIDKITVNASKQFGVIDCEMQMNQLVVEEDVAMVEKNAGELKKAIDLSKEMTGIVKSMSGEQLVYFETKLNLEKIKESDNLETNISLLSMISKKTIVCVGLVGLILPIICISIKYVLSGAIKTADDLVNVTGAVLLGYFEEMKPMKNRIDKFVYKIFHGKRIINHSEKQMEVVSNVIAETLKSNGVKSVCMVASTVCKEDEKLVELRDRIIDKGIVVSVADEFMNNSEGLTLINNTDAVIICEKIGVSRYLEIKNEISLINANKNMVMGCVSL